MAGFVACHQPVFVERYDLLAHAAPDGVFLLNTPAPPDQVWDTLPENMRAQIRDKRLQLWVIDAYAVAAEAGMGRRINTIMQTCFFAISGILPKDEAIAAIKHAVDKTYGRKSKRLVELNYQRHRHDAGGTASGRHSGARPEQSLKATEPRRPPRDGGHSRLRARPHPADLPGPRRPPAGVAAARRRHLSARHRAIREAQHRAGNPGVGGRPLHPVRQVRVRLPAYRHPRARSSPPKPRPMRRRPSSTCRRGARIFPPAPTSATRWRRKTAPAAATASRPARSTTSPTSAGAR